MHCSWKALLNYDIRLILALPSLFVTLHWNNCTAQSTHPIFEQLTTENGLSSNKVEAILQDHEGFYWIATQNGLNRFDGSSFKIYRHNTGDSTSLTHNYCTGIVEDTHGDIWVATYKGVSRFSKAKGSFQSIYLHHPSRNFEITNRIYALATDNAGNIWIAGNGLWKYDIEHDSIILFENVKSDVTSLPSYNLITQLVYDPGQNGVWFITGNELIFYSSTENQFYHKLHNPLGWKVFEHADSRELALDVKNRLWFRDKKTQVLGYFESNLNKITLTSKKINLGIKQICTDEKGRIWIFYWLAAAEIFDPASGTSDAGFFMKYHERSAVSEQGTDLFIDHQKNHWIASDKGISIYNEANQYYHLHHLNVQSLDFDKEPLKINALAQNEPGYLWIATNAGLFKYDLETDNARQVIIPSPVRAITTMYPDGQKLWLGIYDHLLCLDTKTETILKNILLSPGIFFIKKRHNQDLWIGLWSGGFYRMNLRTHELTRYVKTDTLSTSIKSNNLITGTPDDDFFWVGYNAGIGFSKYSISSDTWSHYHPQENELLNSNAGTITVITKDSSDHLWLGTHGNGIFRFNPVSLGYDHYEQSQGLSSNYINSILTDAQGKLWISTADGINYLNTEKNTIRSLDMGLVFSNNDFEANGIEGLYNKMYFFRGSEFAEVDPLAFSPDHHDSQLVISNFKIFDREVGLPGDQDIINLSYQQNFFSFEFSSIKTHPLKEVNYAYQLEGFDKDWILAGHQHFANYTNVPYGNYQFKVKATNDEGQWNENLLAISVHINPPFWRTWWFALAGITFLAIGMYSIYRNRMNQVKRIFSIRAKISQDLHDNVGASLSSIQIYSAVAEKEMKENPDKAREIVQQINQNSRQVMENMSDIVWAMNTGRSEGESLAGRIKNYGYDLLSQKNIECQYSISAEAERKLQQPDARKNILLIVKEALNNIAKYSDASYAQVQVCLEGHHLLVNIVDNGKGFDASEVHAGNGLYNMKQRTEVLGGNFSVLSSKGNGTIIQCHIPITNISDR